MAGLVTFIISPDSKAGEGQIADRIEHLMPDAFVAIPQPSGIAYELSIHNHCIAQVRTQSVAPFHQSFLVRGKTESPRQGDLASEEIALPHYAERLYAQRRAGVVDGYEQARKQARCQAHQSAPFANLDR